MELFGVQWRRRTRVGGYPLHFTSKAELLTVNARANGLRVSSDIRMGCGGARPVLENY